MGDVTELDGYRKSPHITSPAKCLACGHEWLAVAPVGTNVLQCPKCECFKGTFTFFIGSPDGTPAYHCLHCDGYNFEIRRDGVLCIWCGVIHDFDHVFEHTRKPK